MSNSSNYWAGVATRRLNRRRVLAAGAAGSAAAALVACGAKPNAGTTGGTQNQAQNQAPSSGKPQQGGTFTNYVMNNPRLDPQKESAGNQRYISGVYSRIFRF